MVFWHMDCFIYSVGLPISQKKAKHFECLAESLLGERSENFQVPSPNLLPPAFEKSFVERPDQPLFLCHPKINDINNKDLKAPFVITHLSFAKIIKALFTYQPSPTSLD